MRKILSIALFGLFIISGCAGTGNAKKIAKTQTDEVGEGKTERLTLADPFILYDRGVYYAYGTNSSEGFEVFVSDSLGVWQRHRHLALDKKDSFGEKWFWAPEVYHNAANGRYYLFYSAEEHLCVAISDSPLGPFTQPKKEPMINEKAIDSSVFIDTNGIPYMFFVRFTGGNVIWVAQLTEDWMGIKTETLRQCVEADMPWELMMGKVAEGPSVMEKDGTYYLIYSANHYESPDYGVGYATSDNPLGNWIKSADNPILCKPENGLAGTGHGAVFKDKDGQEMYVFHAHWNKSRVQPRTLHIAPIKIAEGSVSIDSRSIISPVVKR